VKVILSRPQELAAKSLTAIEAILQRTDGEGCRPKSCQFADPRRRTVTEWRDDQETAAFEIKARLARGGFDQVDINAEVFVQARELFAIFDYLMQSAQSRRMGLMREISVRREFAMRVRRVSRTVDGL
jgi:hypothetical protein